jgi:hypothetical protein
MREIVFRTTSFLLSCAWLNNPYRPYFYNEMEVIGSWGGILMIILKDKISQHYG